MSETHDLERLPGVEGGNGKVLSSYVIINGSSGKLIDYLIDCVSLML